MEVDLSRVRRPSRRFGWVDRRLLTEGHLAPLEPVPISVYLMLCVVADRHGVSWYAPQTLAGLVKCAPDRIRPALESLADARLVACTGRYVQVLDLDPQTSRTDASVRSSTQEPTPTKDVPCESARDRLARLSTDARKRVQDRARARLMRFTQGREPLESTVSALAASLLDEEVA